MSVIGNPITLGSGGGSGSGIGTLLNTTAIGAISTSSTTATDTGVDVTVKGINGYDLLIVEISVNAKVASRHASTTRLIFLTCSSNIGTVAGASLATATWNCKMANVLTNATTRSNTTANGVFPNDCSITTTDNGTATMNIYQKYNSTQTGTINGTYTARVYGVKLYEMIGG